MLQRNEHSRNISEDKMRIVNKFIWTTLHRLVTYSMLVYLKYVLYHLLEIEKNL